MNQGTVLLLDDDEAALLPLTMFFRQDDYRVLTATHAEEAFTLLEDNEVAVVIADQRLPGMLGTEFLREVRRRWPDIVRITLTGYADVGSAVAAINDGHVYRYLTKPCKEEDLRSAVRDSVRSYQLMRENRRLFELTRNQAIELRELNQELEKKVEKRTREVEAKNLELEENFLDVIRLLSSVQELRNSAISGHAVRVARGVRWMARELEVRESEVRDMEIAAVMHDIGKLALPDEILNKDEFNITREDKGLIRQTPLLGEALLSTILRFRQAARIIRHQKERYNGQGFPDGLSGEAIPIGSRVLAIIDTYEEHRKPEWIQESAGERYDPDLVPLFLQYLETLKAELTGDGGNPIFPEDLMEGMVLTRDLYTGRGLLLATSGKLVDKPTLDKILNFHNVDPIPNRIYARLKSAPLTEKVTG